MELHILNDELYFPPADSALPDRLLAIGVNLSTERLLLAYRSGIFPWYDDDVPMWWCPDPRFVLYPKELKISKSMRPILRGDKLRFTTNKAFEQVIRNCQQMPRKDQDGTWINEDIVYAYHKLHEMGFAHSAEAWADGELVGGLYGIRMGKAFFGESMFSKKSNASKFAFIRFVQQLQEDSVELIDCQVHTEHLESLGAKMIPRALFLETINNLIKQ